MIRVVYIAGLIHSGTTLLERIIASEPGAVGVGELNQTLRASIERKTPEYDCTCGQPFNDCPLWGEVFAKANGSSLQAHLLQFIERFNELYPGKIMVDSSKGLDRLDAYRALEKEGLEIDLKVVYLFRDVRGWSHTIHRKGRAPSGRSGARKNVNVIRNAYYWMYQLHKAFRALRVSNFAFLPVSYESVVFGASNELPRLFSFLGVPHSGTAQVTQNPTSHALFGNAMRYDTRRNSAIVYDPAWIRDWRIFFSTPFVLAAIAYSTYLQRRHSAFISTRIDKESRS
jgi:hypothetical protein